jgi:pulcherriminic acid synthase
MDVEGIRGRNGVVIHKNKGDGSGYRSYEVHQRERVGESTEKIKPSQLISPDFKRNPYRVFEVLRENYPFYRNWLSNNYWVTRYDDVTSIFADEANFESRSNAWRYGIEGLGADLGSELSVLAAEEQVTDTVVKYLATQTAERLKRADTPDLAIDFAATFAQALLAELYGIPDSDAALFARLYWQMKRGVSWHPELQKQGRKAIDGLIDYFAQRLKGASVVEGSVLDSLLSLDRSVSANDVVATLLERDHETLHGALANLWCLLLTHPGSLEKVGNEDRLMKLAYLETLRHSPPTLVAERYARHEVERFGKLIPKGALLICAAGAANRDPRVFSEPDRFVVDRPDICQREPRGQYRADGLASGIAFGLGRPSTHPAIPEDRPRSRYALTRDTAVRASMVMLEVCGEVGLATGAAPEMTSLTLGEMHTCWSLPVQV